MSSYHAFRIWIDSKIEAEKPADQPSKSGRRSSGASLAIATGNAAAAVRNFVLSS